MDHAEAHAEAHEHVPHAHDDSPEAIRKEMRKYLIVLGCLAILTVITVAISYLHLPIHEAVALALVVAMIKGSLVAAFFMHLISERRLIYAVLIMTVFFFGLLMWLPWHHHHNAEVVWPGHDISSQGAKPQPAAHGSGH